MIRPIDLFTRILLIFFAIGAVMLATFRYNSTPLDIHWPQPFGPSGLKIERPLEVSDPEGEAFLKRMRRKPVVVPPAGIITLSDVAFSLTFEALYNKRAKYYGREIELSGYVQPMKSPSSPNDYFVGRELFWNCELDWYFVGFLVHGDGPAPAPGSLVRVRGVLVPTKYRNPKSAHVITIPAIRASYVLEDPLVNRRIFPKINFMDYKPPRFQLPIPFF